MFFVWILADITFETSFFGVPHNNSAEVKYVLCGKKGCIAHPPMPIAQYNTIQHPNIKNLNLHSSRTMRKGQAWLTSLVIY